MKLVLCCHEGIIMILIIVCNQFCSILPLKHNCINYLRELIIQLSVDLHVGKRSMTAKVLIF